nr:MAG TPA: hypothetical protein [Caudoviricetes sp.]
MLARPRAGGVIRVFCDTPKNCGADACKRCL